MELDCAGEWHRGQLCGDGSICFGATGACCPEGGGGCVQVSAAQCAQFNGQYYGDGVSCAGVVCIPTDLDGACCKGNGSCTHGPASQCDGIFQGAGSTCGTLPIPCTEQASGACCTHGTCQNLPQPACIAQGGQFQGLNTSCAPNMCAGQGHPGGCCLPNGGGCVDGVTPESCIFIGGTPISACGAQACPS
jgi:hypothetical protein